MDGQPEDRLQTIRSIWQQHQWLYLVAGFLVGLMVFPLLNLIFNDLDEFLTSLAPQAVGIVLTVFFIDALNRRREEHRHIRDMKERLIREAGSGVNSIAKSAVEELRSCNWLTGEEGILQGAHMHSADLQDANLLRANLNRADLADAIVVGALLNGAWLEKAILSRAQLRHVNFNFAKMRQIDLIGADLKGAKLTGVDLRGALLNHADLRGANLSTSNLRGASLESTMIAGANVWSAELDETTILPNGCAWSPGDDLTRFGALIENPYGDILENPFESVE